MTELTAVASTVSATVAEAMGCPKVVVLRYEHFYQYKMHLLPEHKLEKLSIYLQKATKNVL